MGQRDQASLPINLGALRLIREGFAGSGMTQQELAQASDIPRSTLANILSPYAAPRLIHVSQLVKIALALEVDPRDWMAELEALERERRPGGGTGPARKTGGTDDLGAGRARKQPAPKVQKRAARTRADRADRLGGAGRPASGGK